MSAKAQGKKDEVRLLRNEAANVQIGIVGLGLIGGSLAKAIKKRAALTVVALDLDEAVLKTAQSEGAIDQGAVISTQSQTKLSPQDEAAFSLLGSCAIVFICTPTETVARYAMIAARFGDSLITDVASVKVPVLAQVDCDRFVGGHPMAGSEKQGFRHARESLFENAIYVLCPPPQSKLPLYRLRQLEQLIKDIGATPLTMTAADHDRAVATVSHLPHVVASALSLLAARQDRGDLSRLAAGGFRDITRIASADAKLWAGICHQSRQELLPLLDAMTAILSDFKATLTRQDIKAIEEYFYQAAHYRNTLPVDGRGAMSAQSVLTVYINDKPGELGRVTTILGEKGINISNTRIKEYRAYEGGCLQLMISNSEQAVKAAWILKEAGYVCD